MFTVLILRILKKSNFTLFQGKMPFFKKVVIAILLFTSSFQGIAQGPVSAVYHNTTARFNSYFYGKQRIQEVEQALYSGYSWNYTKILPIYPPYDTTFSASQKDLLEDCIKKASISIQRHPGSKWEFDSYLLVGKARMYGSEFPEAIETFKYVNTKSDNRNDRHAALVSLLRTFTEAGEFQNAVAVSDYLKRERLTGDNLKNLFLNLAYLHQMRKDDQQTVRNLSLGEALMNSGKERARINYVAGQLYQKLGADSAALRYYKNTLRNNPDYELAFYTKLNIAQVTEFSNTTDRKKVEKYFRKLLKDRKNSGFKDKIFYEMGAFELKQGNLDEAIAFYKSSVASSVNNDRQKAYSYLKLSEIYYDSLANYELAKSYYDSTVAVIPQDEENYEEIVNRQKILEEFVKQITTIRDNDSLLLLARMNPDQLDELLENVVTERIAREAAEEEKRKKEEKRAAALAASGVSRFNSEEAGTISTSTEGVWYFYNNASISRGRSEFLRKWGQRPLEDNWRRKSSVKTSVSFEESTPENQDPNASTDDETEKGSSVDIEAEKQKLLATIPSTPAENAALLAQIEEAYYQLGNIYNFKLEEKTNAITAFETLISRFDTTAYKPEVLYQLYLLNKPISAEESEKHAQHLQEEFPETVYAKLIYNPRYREETLAKNQTIQKIYATAYDQYLVGNHERSIQIIDSTFSVYDESDYHDNLQLLKIINQGRIEDIYKYQYELNNFIENHPNSELGEYAKSLVKASEEHQINLRSSSKGKYNKNFRQGHYFIVAYSTQPELSKEVPGEIEKVLKSRNFNLTTGNLVLDEKYSMALVNDLPGKGSATNFLGIFKEQSTLKERFKAEIFYEFVITKENFQILYDSKDLKSYLLFFEKNY